ncbi:hypothetical protein AVEN_133770-1 [Araneus ventricosus]|uniref:SOCS box domain-containing protein n=1 Tax=Araneus ventricosus TaxID=182803 RepID=A0A4Y2W4A0_ARAVE|nr:hypothetical protein AVEN_133770-1 [Araneus ventricosus]
MFSTELRYRSIYLKNVRSLVLTSFVSHKTIAHLDLQISQRRLYFRSRYRHWFPIDKTFFLGKDFFCTEESLRNNLVPERRLLYNLNLDFPDGREYSNLRSGSPPVSLPYNYTSLFVAVRVGKYVLEDTLVTLIKPACEQTGCTFKLFKWMADFRPLETVYVPLPIQYSCAMILYRNCVDSEFVMKCSGKLIVPYVFLGTRELKVFEYLLYHARLCDFDVNSFLIKYSCRSSFVDFCIEHLGFRLVHSILKYQDTVYYTEESYEVYKKKIIPDIM